LLWNFKPVQNYKYTEFDEINPRLALSCQWDGAIPDVPVSAKQNPRKALTLFRGRGGAKGGGLGPGEMRKTPPTVAKEKGHAAAASRGKKSQLPGSSSQPLAAFVAEPNPYGGVLDAHDDQINNDSDHVSSSDGSGSSPESSDNDDHAVQPQPVYEEISFPILDKKRKIRFDWEVKNEVASNVAPSLYLGATKLHWRTIGLGGLARRKTELECFMLMDVPIATPTSHGLSILSMTNDSIRDAKSKRGGDLTKSVNHIHHHQALTAPLPPCITIATTTALQLLHLTSHVIQG
jgi:hypothetical protein